MKRFTGVIVSIMWLASLLLLPVFTARAAVPDAELVISQFKVTANDGQFFMLYNTTDQPIDMGLVQLVYFNNYNLSAATSSKIIQLTGELPAHNYYLVNDGPLTLCYRMMINSVSLGLSSTAGSVQVQRLTQPSPGGPVSSSVEDYISWSKTAVTGVQRLPAATNQHLLRQPVDSMGNPNVPTPGTGSWQNVSPSQSDPCTLTTTVTSAPTVVATNRLLMSTIPPPVTIISVAAAASGPYLPAGDVGLMAPVVNELLANPKSPATDADDEFIELYNPNSKPFDLTGFSLETGTTTKHKKAFAAGTMLKPKSFTAFFSNGTGLTLTNSKGQARLLDPFGSAISSSKEYVTAKEGQAWALANNDWFTTTQPTPGLANVINNSAGSGAAGTSGATAGKGGAVQGTSAFGQPASAAGSPASSAAQVATLHPGTLAAVGAMAVGYGAYEYRQDVANRFRQFRNYRAARGKAGG